MTGLDDTKDHILEAACLITDQDLNIVAEGPNIIINQPDSILDAMKEWCKKTHGEVLNNYFNTVYPNHNTYFLSVWVNRSI